MKKILCSLPSLLILAALAGCCANGVCNCNDELADALYFKVNYTAHRQYNGSTQISFNAKDVDTIRIYRTSRPPASGDTVGFVRTTDLVTVARQLGFSAIGDTIIKDVITTTTTTGTRDLINQDLLTINNASPFASTSTTKLSGYTYRIEVLRRQKVAATYYLTNIDLKGRYDANGCCTCYQNTGKTYTLTYRLPATARRPTSRDTVIQVNAADSLSFNRVIHLPYPR